MNKKTQRGRGRFTRVSVTLSAALLAAAAALASFVSGYALAFSRVAGLWGETTLLKARASELETQILQLKNYAVLIDAITTQGKAAQELYNFGNRPAAEAKDSSVSNDHKTQAKGR